MNSKPVDALPEVQGDMRHAMAQDATWRTDGAIHILARYGEIVGVIERIPDSLPQKYGAIQRAILKRSYYVAYFVQEPERSPFLAVLDGRRSPTDIRRIVNTRRRSPHPSSL